MMFVFTLKLLRKLVGLLVKLVLLPVRLLLRLVGIGSNRGGSGGSAAAAAAAGAASAAAGAAANRGTEETTTATTEPAAAPVDPGTRENYDRFRKALYVSAALGALPYLAIAVEFGFAGDLPLVPVAVSIGLPLAVGYWTRTETKAAWGVGMAFAAIMLVLSLLGTAIGVSLGQQLDAVGGGGFAGLLGLFGLLQSAALAAALYFGAVGRAVALGGPAAAVSGETAPAEPTTDEPSGGSATGSSAAEGPPATTASAPAEESAASPSAAGGSTASGGGNTTGATAASTDDGIAEADAADATGAVAEDHGSATDAETATEGEDAVSDEEALEAGGAGEDAGPDLEPLAERAAATEDPAAVRELGDALAAAEPADGLPDEVVTALETCAEADDPEVRVAVCEACEAVETGATDEIVRGLRIDTNDRVATAAMEAY